MTAKAKDKLKTEAGKLADELRRIPGLKIKTRIEPWASDTRGYGCVIATWNELPSVQLYYDRAAGSDRFRFWTGFGTEESAQLDRILGTLPKDQAPTTVMEQSDIREWGEGDWAFRNPKESELARPFVEKYSDDGTYFYGLYDWGGHATRKLSLDTFKAAQFIRNVVERVDRGKAKRNGRRAPIDIEHKAAVEDEAIKAVKQFFQEQGFEIESREADNCGWDLDVAKPGILLRAEVKGLSGNGFIVELSPNEFNMMRRDPNYRVCIVSKALSQKLRKVRVFRPRGTQWINDAGETLDVQERIAARLTVIRK